jgi:hypothetical protein
MLLMRLLREVVAPVLTGYLVVLGMLVAYRRAASRREVAALRPRPVPTDWPGLVRHVVGTAAGGYAFFLLLVVVFYFILGGHSSTLVTDALVYGSLLAFAVVVPVFLVLSWVQGRIRARGRARS